MILSVNQEFGIFGSLRSWVRLDFGRGKTE